jgi:predicted regulator of Ras-like GTPase activity (Roadblock/LC7/MglB family)
MSYEAVLAELLALREQVTGVTETAVAAVDGLLVAADTEIVRPEVISALAAAALGLGKRTGYETGLGDLREVVIRCGRGHVVVYSIRDEGLLVVVGDEGLDVARLHVVSRKTVERLAGLLVEETPRPA